MLYLETDGRWCGAKCWHHATCSLHLLVPLLACPLLALSSLCASRPCAACLCFLAGYVWPSLGFNLCLGARAKPSSQTWSKLNKFVSEVLQTVVYFRVHLFWMPCNMLTPLFGCLSWTFCCGVNVAVHYVKWNSGTKVLREHTWTLLCRAFWVKCVGSVMCSHPFSFPPSTDTPVFHTLAHIVSMLTPRFA